MWPFTIASAKTLTLLSVTANPFSSSICIKKYVSDMPSVNMMFETRNVRDSVATTFLVWPVLHVGFRYRKPYLLHL